MRNQRLILSVVILLTMLAAHSAFATPITLTKGGYELSEGNHGPSLAVSDNLTLFAITRIGQIDYGDGVNGINGGITVQTGGIGVKGVDLNDDGTFNKYGGSDPLSGDGKHQDEAIIFDYSHAVSLSTITLDIINTKWLKKDGIQPDKDVNLEIKLNAVNESLFLPYGAWTPYGSNSKYGTATLILSDLFPAFTGTVDEFKLTVTEGHLRINDVSTPSTPTPEPATMLLLSFGLIALIGLRKKLKK